MDNIEPQSGLQQALLRLLEVPQLMLLREIGEMNCIHDADFCWQDKQCWDCDLGENCLGVIGKFGSVSKTRNLQTCLAMIELARNYVRHKVTSLNHEQRTCFCEACCWLRETNKLVPPQNKRFIRRTAICTPGHKQ